MGNRTNMIFLKSLALALALAVSVPSVLFAQSIEAAEATYARGDYSSALREYRLLAEAGNAAAQYSLGSMYSMGKGVPRDDVEAVRWFRLAAERGYASAIGSLAFAYNQGEGVEQSHPIAINLYRLAVKKGDYYSSAHLGFAYARGDGVIKDKVLEHMWFNIACAHGVDVCKERDDAEREMTSLELSEAQRRARICISSNYTDCE